jgi:hypothetical protein
METSRELIDGFQPRCRRGAFERERDDAIANAEEHLTGRERDGASGRAREVAHARIRLTPVLLEVERDAAVGFVNRAGRRTQRHPRGARRQQRRGRATRGSWRRGREARRRHSGVVRRSRAHRAGENDQEENRASGVTTDWPTATSHH